MPAATEGREASRVAPAALEAWTAEVLVALGVQPGHARSTARSLVDASARGVDSHGVARLPAYVRLIDLGHLDVAAAPRVVLTSGATAVIDAGNGLGQPAGELAMDTAVALAARLGVGWAVVRRSNHLGTVGYYVRRAAERGYVALAATNSASVVAPTRARARFLGTNPMAFAAPTADGPPVVLDMSTSGVSGGKLEVAMRTGAPIPEGWGITADGAAATDPAAVLPAGGALLPLGGTEEHGSYKGYGLGLMVEVLTGLLVGGAFAGEVGPLTSSTPTGPADVSHVCIALDPARFGDRDAFAGRLTELCARLRALPAVDPELPVLVPGDPEEEALAARTRDGIPLDPVVADALGALARRTGIDLPGVPAHADVET